MLYANLRFKKTLAVFGAIFILALAISASIVTGGQIGASTGNIKWVDFNASYPALKKAMDLDINSHRKDEEIKYDWIEILAYITAKNGNKFSGYKSADIDSLVEKRKSGKTMEELTKDMKYYKHYLEIYQSVLGEYIGSYQIQTMTEKGTYKFVEKYGLKVFSPIAEGSWYEDFDDFGAGRTYGYKRKHLGHDIMASLGTPIVAIESGTVEELGWNQYGGWRIGIRSHDKKRYYYYAHMRKDRPYSANITKGCEVQAGDVIGYMGRTGYSTTENINNITENHLHLGLQLIFDEDQKDTNEIWIDLYAITKLLSANRSTVVRNAETKEYSRKYDIILSASANVPPDDAYESKEVPVLMYHSILNHPKSGNKYEVKTSELENDLKYLKENGYHTVTVKDLVNFVYKGSSLPEKPVVLTFDDGNYNNMYYAESLLKQYGFKAVLSIVGSYSEASTKTGDVNPNYSYVTWEQVKELTQNGVFEIQNHTWDMHSVKNGNKGSKQKKGESDSAYEKRFTEDVKKLQDKLMETTGQKPQAFTYPYGYLSRSTTDMLKNMEFLASFSCAEGTQTISRGDPESLFLMKRYLRSQKKSAQAILSKNK